jgi:hypothetical protein
LTIILGHGLRQLRRRIAVDDKGLFGFTLGPVHLCVGRTVDHPVRLLRANHGRRLCRLQKIQHATIGRNHLAAQLLKPCRHFTAELPGSARYQYFHQSTWYSGNLSVSLSIGFFRSLSDSR